MPPRPVRLRLPPPDTLAEGFAAIRAEIGVPGAFPADALAEAEGATDAHAGTRVDATDVPFVTVDPAGSMDLDQALHIERAGDGFRVRYAIADVAAFVVAGGALDREAWARGVTHYSPDGRAPLYPPALSEGSASLLPDGERPALLWTIELDARGERVAVALGRARVRSRERLTYGEAQTRIDGGEDGALGLLREVGVLREARERDRGGVSLPVPEQEVEPGGADGSAGWLLRYRAPLPVEGWNAQISLLTGMAAADLMLEAQVGFLRTVPAPEPGALARLRAVAQALGAPWPADRPYPEFVRSLDPAVPAHAAILRSATGLMRGAGYVAFDGAPPPADQTRHAAIAEEYAHVTAPLRRLADRYGNECCLAASGGAPLPAWVPEALPRLAEAMKAADRRAGALDRAVVDLVEAALLAGREGETFPAVVVDVDSDRPRGTVQLADPAVRGRIDGADLPLGEAVEVRLVGADPTKRHVRFAIV